MSTEMQQTLTEVRCLSSKFDELSLQIRVDTPWVRFRENVRYGIACIAEIPLFSRLCVLGATMCLLIPAFVEMASEIKRKLYLTALNLVAMAVTVIGYV